MTEAMIRRFGLLAAALLAGACDSGPPGAPPCEDTDCIRLLVDIPVEDLALRAPSGSPVTVGVFLSVAHAPPPSPWSEAEAAAYVASVVNDAAEILDQCGLHIEVEVAQVIALPERLLDIVGNDPDSFGGHPPPGTPDPDRFDYDQNERLTDEVRELFTYGKRFASRNAISAFTVRHIEYYAEQELTAAGGLSFPPNSYHHPDDYPLRNSVLLVPRYDDEPGALPDPLGSLTLAHEIGHMLLNSGGHVSDFANLMSSFGTELTSAQCERMRDNLERLFGDEEVPDPGPPL